MNHNVIHNALEKSVSDPLLQEIEKVIAVVEKATSSSVPIIKEQPTGKWRAISNFNQKHKKNSLGRFCTRRRDVSDTCDKSIYSQRNSAANSNAYRRAFSIVRNVYFIFRNTDNNTNGL